MLSGVGWRHNRRRRVPWAPPDRRGRIENPRRVRAMATRLSKAYLLTKVLTATKQEVVVYLYEGAISYLHRAGQALKNGDTASAGMSIERTISILIELAGNLNFNRGGALALRLNAIYNYLIESLSMAASRADETTIEACRGILVILHDAWQQAATAQ